MQWFKSLSSQEQKLMRLGVIIVTIAISWAFVYQPMTQAIELKSKQKYELQNQYKQMQSSRKIFEEQKVNAVNFHRDLNKPFISWIDEQLAKNQLTQFVTRSEPKDNQTVILTFESIIFDELAKWLQPLEVNYRVKISEVDIHLTDRSNGLCNARITLEESR